MLIITIASFITMPFIPSHIFQNQRGGRGSLSQLRVLNGIKNFQATKSAVKLYNEIRLHLSLNYRTPNMVYKLTA